MSVRRALPLRCAPRAEMMPVEHSSRSVQRSRPTGGEARWPARQPHSGHRAAHDPARAELGNGRRHPGARSDSISSATASISARSPSSASRAATSVASSLLRRRRLAEERMADLIASDWLKPVDSRVRNAFAASSSSRTEIAFAMHSVYHDVSYVGTGTEPAVGGPGAKRGSSGRGQTNRSSPI